MILQLIIKSLTPVFQYMYNPDCVKGDTPTLREQMAAQERVERNKPKQCYACGSSLPT